MTTAHCSGQGTASLGLGAPDEIVTGSVLRGAVDALKATTAGKVSTAALAIGIALLLLDQFFRSRIHSDEPPVLKPRVPFIGHLMGMLSGNQSYIVSLQKHKPAPIYTMPILNGKMYVATSPAVIQTALKTKSLSFDPFQIDFVQQLLGLDDATMAMIRDQNKSIAMVPDIAKAIHAGLNGDSLVRTNRSMLSCIATELNSLPDDLAVPNFWLWFRDLLARATTKSLFGSHSPFELDPTLFDDIWTFDKNVPSMLVSPFPRLTHSKTIAARNRLQKALVPFYEGGHELEPDVAAVIRNRAETLRRHGFNAGQVAQTEITIVLASVQNAIPTGLWLILNVFQRPDWVERIREEVRGLVAETQHEDSSRVAQLDVSSVEEKAPFLVACYKETLRLISAQTSVRRVMKDTYLTDGAGGRYLLQKGSDLLLPSGVTHGLEDVWEASPSEFHPENFLAPEQSDVDDKAQSEREKARKAAHIPFGGGRHLCPGRKFALYENMAIMAALVTGFELAAADGGRRLPSVERGRVRLGEAVSKPVNDGQGSTVRIKRRRGWERVQWEFVC